MMTLCHHYTAPNSRVLGLQTHSTILGLAKTFEGWEFIIYRALHSP